MDLYGRSVGSSDVRYLVRYKYSIGRAVTVKFRAQTLSVSRQECRGGVEFDRSLQLMLHISLFFHMKFDIFNYIYEFSSLNYKWTTIRNMIGEILRSDTISKHMEAGSQVYLGEI